MQLPTHLPDDRAQTPHHRLREGFEAAAGWWHMTGPQALGLARVRHDAGGSAAVSLLAPDIAQATLSRALARGGDWAELYAEVRNNDKVARTVTISFVPLSPILTSASPDGP